VRSSSRSSRRRKPNMSHSKPSGIPRKCVGQVRRYPAAVRGRVAHGRGDASFGAAVFRHVRRQAANQNGAPIRMVIPWKYGFKSIKSIVKIKFVGGQPSTTWNIANAGEYGFLLERESGRRSSPLEPGQRAPVGRVLQARYASLQRLWPAGGFAIRRHGPEKELLSAPMRKPWVKSLAFGLCLSHWKRWHGTPCTASLARIPLNSSRISRATGPSGSW